MQLKPPTYLPGDTQRSEIWLARANSQFAGVRRLSAKWRATHMLWEFLFFSSRGVLVRRTQESRWLHRGTEPRQHPSRATMPRPSDPLVTDSPSLQGVGAHSNGYGLVFGLARDLVETALEGGDVNGLFFKFVARTVNVEWLGGAYFRDSIEFSWTSVWGIAPAGLQAAATHAVSNACGRGQGPAAQTVSWPSSTGSGEPAHERLVVVCNPVVRDGSSTEGLPPSDSESLGRKVWAALLAPEPAQDFNHRAQLLETLLLHGCPFASDIEAMCTGRTTLDPADSVATLAPQFAEEIKKLTSTQRIVLEHLLAGLPEKEIARRMFRSRHTVHSHVEAIYARLGFRSRVDLLTKMLTGGLRVSTPIRPRANVTVRPWPD